MNRTIVLLAVVAPLLAAVWYSSNPATGQEKKMPRVYELRIYTTHEGRLPALEKRFQEHTLRLFEKHGMKNETYWKPLDPERRENTLIYVVSHESVDAAKKSWQAFVSDPDWIKARDASEADGKIVAKVESVYMESVDWLDRK
jgi:hypothetical protein